MKFTLKSLLTTFIALGSVFLAAQAYFEGSGAPAMILTAKLLLVACLVTGAALIAKRAFSHGVKSAADKNR